MRGFVKGLAVLAVFLVAVFQLEYLTRDGAWRDRWPLLGEADVPRAVRLSLTLADGAQIDRWFTLR